MVIEKKSCSGCVGVAVRPQATVPSKSNQQKNLGKKYFCWHTEGRGEHWLCVTFLLSVFPFDIYVVFPVGVQEKENSMLGASPEKVTDRTRDPERTGQVEETKFSQVSSHQLS
jgi:hypothetical protein